MDAGVLIGGAVPVRPGVVTVDKFTTATAEEWERRKDEWLPSLEDKAYLHSIQATPIYKPGQFANYIAPPARG